MVVAHQSIVFLFLVIFVPLEHLNYNFSIDQHFPIIYEIPVLNSATLSKEFRDKPGKEYQADENMPDAIEELRYSDSDVCRKKKKYSHLLFSPKTS